MLNCCSWWISLLSTLGRKLVVSLKQKRSTSDALIIHIRIILLNIVGQFPLSRVFLWQDTVGVCFGDVFRSNRVFLEQFLNLLWKVYYQFLAPILCSTIGTRNFPWGSQNSVWMCVCVVACLKILSCHVTCIISVTKLNLRKWKGKIKTKNLVLTHVYQNRNIRQ